MMDFSPVSLVQDKSLVHDKNLTGTLRAVISRCWPCTGDCTSTCIRRGSV